MEKNQIKANREGSSQMAEGIAMQRFAESSKGEDERICYDPYAIHFIRPEIIEFGKKHPEEAKELIENTERLFPGLSSSIMSRVRYFDDFVKKSVADGLKQLVILGAGYDTRAYRIEELKEDVNIFEMDHPNTQGYKIETIKEIFGSIPENVIYVPVDFEKEKISEKLVENGFISSKKTLFILEGLVMYIPPESVAEIFSFITENSAKGSMVIFDYYPQSVVDGTSRLEVGQNIRNHLLKIGEPLQFGIEEEEIENFLKEFGFSSIENVTSEDYKKAYFQGKNEKRDVCELLYFAHAVV
ncbi:MAG: SAM-dependent methyltransferase [Methanobacterium formicicum]